MTVIGLHSFHNIALRGTSLAAWRRGNYRDPSYTGAPLSRALSLQSTFCVEILPFLCSGLHNNRMSKFPDSRLADLTPSARP
jgi:hypothetical protein